MLKKFIQKPFRYSFYNISLCLIVINCIIFALTSLFPQIKGYLGLSPFGIIKYKMLWQPLSYMFTHGNLTHLLSNMIGLLFFGIAIERAIGSKEFALFYFSTGIISGLLSVLIYVLTKNYFAILIGASGALYAVMLAYAVIFPRSTVYIFGIIPISSPIMVIAYAGIEFFSQFSTRQSNVAHTTHLLGFLVAWIYFLVRMGINPIKIWKNAYR